MKNEILNKKAFEITNKKLSITMLNLISDICIINQMEDLPKNFEIYQNHLNSLFLDLKNIFNKGYNERINQIKNLENIFLNFKKDAIKMLAIFENIDFAYKKLSKYINLDTYEVLPKNLLLNRIKHFLYNQNELPISPFNQSLIFSLIPYCMTKDFYKDYMYASMNFFFQDLPKSKIVNYLDYFKFKFYSLDLIEDDFLKNKLKNIFNINLENLNNEQIFDLFQEIKSLKDDYSKFESQIIDISTTFIDLNIIYNLVFSSQDLFENNFILNDLFNATLDMLQNNSKDIMLETILNKTENQIENNFDEFYEEELNFRKQISKIDFKNLPENAKMYITIDEFSSKNPEFEIIISNEFFENDIATDEFIFNKIDEFFAYIQNIDLPNKSLNYFRQKFFKYVPFCLENSFLIEHCEYVINNLSEKSFLLFQNEMIENFGLQDSLQKHNTCQCSNHNH